MADELKQEGAAADELKQEGAAADELKQAGAADGNPFSEAVGKLSEEKWKLYQSLGGALLGVIAAMCLFFVGAEDGGFLSIGFIIALLLAKFAPDYIEKMAKRPVNRGRVAMLIAMGASILLYLAYVYFVKGIGPFGKA